MMRPCRRLGTSARTMIAAAALAPWLAGCASGDEPDALSRSSELGGQPVYVLLVSRDQPAPIVSSTTADYGDYGVSVPGTDWGRADGFHTQCVGGCRTSAGGS